MYSKRFLLLMLSGGLCAIGQQTASPAGQPPKGEPAQIAGQRQLPHGDSSVATDQPLDKEGRPWANGRPIANAHAQTVQRVDPPLFGFYAKLITCDGIPIRSAAVVQDAALLSVCGKVTAMLEHLTVARQNMIERGSEIHIIGKDQLTTDLPELRVQRGEVYVDSEGHKTDLDKRARGLGGIYTDCAEENILHLAGDGYHDGTDICLHEIGHNIMDFGLGPGMRDQIVQQYKRSIAAGRWKGRYDAVNPKEYFASITMWYFGNHGDFADPARRYPAPGPAGLQAYDPGGFSLLQAIYSGREQPVAIHEVPVRNVSRFAHSGSGTQNAQLLLVNNTGLKLRLLWVAQDGHTQDYGKLDPYLRSTRDTVISHVWRIEDPSGNTLARFQANAPNCLAVIDPPR